MKKLVFVGIIVVILFIIGMVWYANKNQTAPSPAPEVTQQNTAQETNTTTNSTNHINNQATQTTQITQTTSTNPKNIVTIENLAFSPNTIMVKAGSIVTWTNNDPMAHTVVGNNNSIKSATLSNGQSYSYIFNTSGTYSYRCGIHPSMKGTVIVQ